MNCHLFSIERLFGVLFSLWAPSCEAPGRYSCQIIPLNSILCMTRLFCPTSALLFMMRSEKIMSVSNNKDYESTGIVVSLVNLIL